MEGTESGTDNKRASAVEYYREHKCDHEACSIPDAEDLAFSFASLSEDIRIDTVRCMLLALTSPKGHKNSRIQVDTEAYQYRKEKRRRDGSDGYSATMYTLKGVRVCRDYFLSITQISGMTLSRHAVDVSSSPIFERYATNRDKSHYGKLSAQTVTVIAFLYRYKQLHGLMCPSGRGRSTGELVSRLPSDTIKADVYIEYKEAWADIIDAAMTEVNHTKRPESPLKYASFIK
eukprot:IDg913t1